MKQQKESRMILLLKNHPLASLLSLVTIVPTITYIIIGFLGNS
ncbi:MAG: hypothetical protein WC099_01200 [Candidatus Paceibacterota bacterium]